MKRFFRALVITLCLSMFTTSVVPIVGTETVQAATKSKTKIKLNCTKKTIYEGDSFKLKVIGTSKKVKWSSSNKNVATVSSKGVVKGINEGSTQITASVNKKKYTCNVTVNVKDYSHGISYKILEVLNNKGNPFEYILKVDNKNNVDVIVPIKIQSIDSEGYTVLNIEREIQVYENDSTYYYIGSSDFLKNTYDVSITIDGITQRCDDLCDIDYSIEVNNDSENNKNVNVICKNNSNKDAKYYRFITLEIDSNGNIVGKFVSDFDNIPANGKVKDNRVYVNDNIEKFEVHFFQAY